MVASGSDGRHYFPLMPKTPWRAQNTFHEPEPPFNPSYKSIHPDREKPDLKCTDHIREWERQEQAEYEAFLQHKKSFASCCVASRSSGICGTSYWISGTAIQHYQAFSVNDFHRAYGEIQRIRSSTSPSAAAIIFGNLQLYPLKNFRSFCRETPDFFLYLKELEHELSKNDYLAMLCNQIRVENDRRTWPSGKMSLRNWMKEERKRHLYKMRQQAAQLGNSWWFGNSTNAYKKQQDNISHLQQFFDTNTWEHEWFSVAHESLDDAILGREIEDKAFEKNTRARSIALLQTLGTPHERNQCKERLSAQTRQGLDPFINTNLIDNFYGNIFDLQMHHEFLEIASATVSLLRNREIMAAIDHFDLNFLMHATAFGIEFLHQESYRAACSIANTSWAILKAVGTGAFRGAKNACTFRNAAEAAFAIAFPKIYMAKCAFDIGCCVITAYNARNKIMEVLDETSIESLTELTKLKCESIWENPLEATEKISEALTGFFASGLVRRGALGILKNSSALSSQLVKHAGKTTTKMVAKQQKIVNEIVDQSKKLLGRGKHALLDLVYWYRKYPAVLATLKRLHDFEHLFKFYENSELAKIIPFSVARHKLSGDINFQTKQLIGGLHTWTGLKFFQKVTGCNLREFPMFKDKNGVLKVCFPKEYVTEELWKKSKKSILTIDGKEYVPKTLWPKHFSIKKILKQALTTFFKPDTVGTGTGQSLSLEKTFDNSLTVRLYKETATKTCFPLFDELSKTRI